MTCVSSVIPYFDFKSALSVIFSIVSDCIFSFVFVYCFTRSINDVFSLNPIKYIFISSSISFTCFFDVSDSVNSWFLVMSMSLMSSF